MNSSTPLTRCNTCQTVFEVPQSILDSSDSRVRCGECLQVFDAGRNLHLVEKPDLSLLAVAGDYDAPVDDESQVSEDTGASEEQGDDEPSARASEPVQEASGHLFANSDQVEKTADKADQVAADNEQSADTAKTATSLPQDQMDDRESDAQLENTHTDFDLFGRETELPEVSFEDSTMDAIRLDFDLVDDADDETLSDTLFANDVTIDAASQTATSATSTEAEPSTENSAQDSQQDSQLDSNADSNVGVGPQTDTDSVSDSKTDAANKERATEQNTDNSNFAAALQRTAEHKPEEKSEAVSRAEQTLAAIAQSANTDFQLDESAAPPPLEFDYRAPATSQPPSQAVVSETPVPATLEADALEQSSASQGATEGLLPQDRTAQQTLASPRSGAGLRRWLSRIFMALLVLVIVGALYTWTNRGQLADNSITRPGYQLWCLFSECEVPARLDTSKLAVVSKTIFSHPNLEDALVITIVIKNNAKFEQRYPNLFLWLSDRMRRTVASSEFASEVYLEENDLPSDSTLAPGQQQRISIDVLDPGDEAVSLELDFR